MTPSTQTYDLAQTSWPGSLPLEIRDETGQRLCTVPKDFLVGSAVEPLALLTHIAGMCVTEPGFLVDRNLEKLSEAVQLDGSGLVWMRQDQLRLPCTFEKGPRFKYATRAPPAGSESTMSNSKRSSANQDTFRKRLLVRDATCLLSDANDDDCTASHIIPQSRPEYYKEIIGYEETHPFHASYGLLLADNLHHAFDRGEWALWPDGDDLAVHYFRPTSSVKRSYHGKRIQPSRFRGDAQNHPNRALLLFHYRQCVMKHIRGFAAGF